ERLAFSLAQSYETGKPSLTLPRTLLPLDMPGFEPRSDSGWIDADRVQAQVDDGHFRSAGRHQKAAPSGTALPKRPFASGLRDVPVLSLYALLRRQGAG